MSKPVCLLTGASGRFGMAFCAAYCEEYSIAGLYSKREPEFPSQHSRFRNPLAPEMPIRENQSPLFTIQCDLLLKGECDRVLDIVLARFGSVDLLINAAGIGHWASLTTSSRLISTARDQFHMNALVPLTMSSALFMRCWRDSVMDNKERGRNIINISSLAASQVFRSRGQSVYAASKAALSTLTLHMADEYAPFGIRVNTLEPNSFPSLVRTEAVTSAAVELARGHETGQTRRIT